MNHNQNVDDIYCIRFADFKPVDFFHRKTIAIDGASAERLEKGEGKQSNSKKRKCNEMQLDTKKYNEVQLFTAK